MMHKVGLSGMRVIKRNGQLEDVQFDKILNRIDILVKKCKLIRVNPVIIAQDTIRGLHNKITTEDIDNLASIQCAHRMKEDVEYDKLAVAICVSRLHKITNKDFMQVSDELKLYTLISDEYYNFVKDNIDTIKENIDYSRDYRFDYFGFKTLERSYLHKVKDGKNSYIAERPQHMWMRVALGLNLDNIDDAMETYQGLSLMEFIFGSPTLFNSGSDCNQMSSCFLLKMGDSIEEIYETIKQVALISKRAGGIGISMSDIRASGSLIKGTNGISNGPIPFIQELNYTGRAVNQGGRRNGSIAIYIEPWHSDVFHFCELRSNKGNEDLRARDIFLALWVPDLFMKRLKEHGIWSLMCPDECKGLTQVYGEEFEELYTKYEREGKFKKQVKASELWVHIINNQFETGMPYMVYKDHVNRKSNQKNSGVIQSSNLCAEVVELSSPEEIAVCNLSSLCLPKFVKVDKNGQKYFDFKRLEYVARLATKNLNKVIDINYYPVKEAQNSNFKHRPIGLGIQGLADVYFLFDYPYDSTEARILNRQIFETIYYGALKMSVQLAKEFGPYSTFEGSPFSKGQLQFHLWGLPKDKLLMNYDWEALIDDVMTFGTRNSLLTTVMPTASTSQIMGNFESMEPVASNVYTRTTLAGEFTVVNKHLVDKLLHLNLWTDNVRNELLYDRGSVQQIAEIPDKIKKVFRTAFELENKPIIDQSIERGPFIDQSQSLNLFCSIPDSNKLTRCHFYGWENGIKTGMYYLKTHPATSAIQFGLDYDVIENIKEKRGGKKDENVHHIDFETPCGGSCSA